jgi:hypothetical protein
MVYVTGLAKVTVKSTPAVPLKVNNACACSGEAPTRTPTKPPTGSATRPIFDFIWNPSIEMEQLTPNDWSIIPHAQPPAMHRAGHRPVGFHACADGQRRRPIVFTLFAFFVPEFFCGDQVVQTAEHGRDCNRPRLIGWPPLPWRFFVRQCAALRASLGRGAKIVAARTTPSDRMSPAAFNENDES